LRARLGRGNLGGVIDKLEMFLALAQARHFGRAAEAVGVTQPSLSAAIRSLEDGLGVPLVRRGSRYLGLTPEGERALVWARRIVADARSLREELRPGREGLAGTLRLGVIPTALGPAARLTAAFARAHPGARVTILSLTSAAILEDIEALRLDAGVTYLDAATLDTATGPDRTAFALYDESYALILRDDHPLAQRSRLAWAELAGVDLCLLTPDMQNRRIVAGHLAEAGVAVAPRVEANSIIALLAHVLHGGWASVLPLGAAEIFLAHGPLRAIPLDEAPSRHRVGLLAPAREPQRPLLAAFLAEARRLWR
jgi:DNA-binding transcriptional LysR family regulator